MLDRKFVLIITIFMIFAGFSATVLNETENLATQKEYAMRTNPGTEYVTHSIIIINSNAEFENYASTNNWSGSGTASDPYHISGYDIDPNGAAHAIYIGNTTLYFIIENSYFHGGGDSLIALYNTTHGIIQNDSFDGSSAQGGIYLIDSSDIIVNNCTFNNFSDYLEYSVYALNSDHNTIENCTSISSGVHIVINHSYNNTIKNNTLKDNLYSGAGIEIDNSGYNTVDNNTIYPMGSQNIYLYNSTHNTIKNNTLQITYYIYQAKNYGIYLLKSNENLIIYNYIKGYLKQDEVSMFNPDFLAIYIQNSTYNNVSYNNMINSGIYLTGVKKTFTTQTMYNNTVNGRMVYYFSNVNNINGSKFTNAGQYLIGNVSNAELGNLSITNISTGVEVGYSHNVTFNNITINNMQYGIYIVNSTGITIKNSKLKDDIGSRGTERQLNEVIYISRSSNILLYNVSAIGGYKCLDLHYVNNSTLQHLTLGNSSDGTTYLLQWYHSSNNTIENSTLNDNSNGMYLDSMIDTSVKNNKFLSMQTSIIIENDYLLNITGNYFYKGFWGIHTKSANNFTIANNRFSDFNNYAIYATYNPINGNVIRNNAFSGCAVGIYVLHSNNYKIYGNTLSYSSEEAIYLKYSENNTVYSNKLIKNEFGIAMENSQNNTVFANNITAGFVGIEAKYTGMNSIKKNFINDSDYGIEIASSNPIKLYSNVMTKTGIFIIGNQTTFVNQAIPANNTINGLPVIYIKNKNLNNASFSQITSTIPGEIILGNVTGLKIKNYQITNTTVSIETGFSDYISLIDNKIGYNHVWGIYMDYTNFTTLTNNSYCNNTKHGTYLLYSNHTEILDNTYLNNKNDGLHMVHANNTKVINNKFYGNTATAIYFKYGSYSTILNNTAVDNNYGMWVDYFTHNLISGNNFSDNNEEGVHIVSSSHHNEFIDNNISNNNMGVDIENSNYIILKQNKINDNSWDGVDLDPSSYSTLENNSISNNGGSNLYISSSHHIKINNNSLNGAGFSEGIDLESSSDIIINGNTISHNQDEGIYDLSSNYILIANNTIYHNQYNGIYIYSAKNITLLSNKISSSYSEGYESDEGNGAHILYSTSIKIENNTIYNNINYGLNLYHLKNSSINDNLITSNNWEGIYISYSSHNNITNNTFTKNNEGIRIKNSEYNIIGNNTIYDIKYYGDGICLDAYAKYNIITNNSITNNNNNYPYNVAYGLIISKSADNNIILGNTIANVGDYGIIVFGKEELIQENKIISDKIGIEINSNYNTLLLNILTDNKMYGVEIVSGSNNTIYNNTFICNNGSNSKYSSAHIQAYDNGTNNSWFFMNVGNYWCDWANNNNTNDQNHDGIVDWPYKIAGWANATDEYPLKNFTVGSPPTAPTNFGGSSGNRYVFIKWNKPVCNGTSPVLKYMVYRNGKLIVTLPSSELSFKDTNVTNGNKYTYFVIAINSAGAGPPSSRMTFTPETVPSAPHLNASVGEDYVILSWTRPYDGGAKINEYKIYRFNTLIATVPGNQLWYNDTGVFSGREYSYHIIAVNSVGDSAPSNEVIVTIPGTVPELTAKMQILIIMIIALLTVFARKNKKN